MTESKVTVEQTKYPYVVECAACFRFTQHWGNPEGAEEARARHERQCPNIRLAHAMELLEELAPEEPINQDEMGGCVWCAGRPAGQAYGYATADPADHTDDCPWVAARELIEREDQA